MRIVSPAPEGNPYTVNITVESADPVEIWADRARIGEVPPNGTLRWRAPEAGDVRLDAYAMRDGRAVARDQRTVEVGVGLDSEVLAEVARYPTDGSMGYWWPPDDGIWWGTPHDLTYDGTLVSPADPEGRSHCVGLTWEVGMEALEAEAGGGVVNDLTLDDVTELRTDWFVRRIFDKGAADAVAHYGVGELVPWRDLQPGDFLQMWYPGGGGHSAVFIDWVRQGRRIVGLRYWSTHPALGGIGYREERFGEGGPSKALLYGARLWQREDWLPR